MPCPQDKSNLIAFFACLIVDQDNSAELQTRGCLTDLAEEVDGLVDEEGWHGDAGDQDEGDEDDLEGEVVDVEVPLHAVDRAQLAERLQPQQEQFLSGRVLANEEIG